MQGPLDAINRIELSLLSKIFIQCFQDKADIVRSCSWIQSAATVIMFCSSISSNLSKKLLKSVQINDTKSLEKLLLRDSSLLNHEFSTPHHNHNVLIVACNDQNGMNHVSAETLRKLIDLGANPTEPTKNDNWEAIHYAAINANLSKLEVIVECLNDEELNSLVYCSRHVPRKYKFLKSRHMPKSYSNNALSVLLKYGNRNNQFVECCELLVRSGINIHQADSNGVTPLQLMQDEHNEKLDDICKLQVETSTKNVFQIVEKGDEKKFLALELAPEVVEDVDGPNETFSSCTLLQLCCFKGLTLCVERLLRSGVSPNRTIPKNGKFPILIAMMEDHEDIVKLFLSCPTIDLPIDILIKLQMKYKNTKNLTKIDKYMELVLRHLQQLDKKTARKYLLAKDELNRTGLHYAAYYRCSDIVLELLSMGAPLTEKDIFGLTPLNSIEPSTLEKFLDQCVDIPRDSDEISNMFHSLRNNKEKFSIEINYESLITTNDENEGHESEFLDRLIKIKSLTYLMNHPVVSSFLALKWQKFRWVVYTNLIMYFIAYISLLFYGFAHTWNLVASNSLLLAAVVSLSICEAIEIVIFRLSYFKRIENILNWFLIGGVIYIIASSWYQSLVDKNLLVAFSVVFLTSTLGIFLQLGNLPFFTVKVIILGQITKNFCKYMVFYMFPVLAFFFCFYMLNQSRDEVFFQTLYDITTMFAGDPDKDYPEQFVENPIFSHLMYICFIVLIGIILQNLLIGLAVSDLQEIQKEAEFIDKKERARYITNIEHVLFGQFRESKHWLFKPMFRKLLKASKVFRKERVLVVQPYNSGCVFLRENPKSKQYIRDEVILNLLQNIYKDLSMHKDNDGEEPYSVKALHEKLETIEKMLEKLLIRNE